MHSRTLQRTRPDGPKALAAPGFRHTGDAPKQRNKKIAAAGKKRLDFGRYIDGFVWRRRVCARAFGVAFEPSWGITVDVSKSPRTQTGVVVGTPAVRGITWRAFRPGRESREGNLPRIDARMRGNGVAGIRDSLTGGAS